MIKSLLITGYSSFDLGIFRGNDPKIAIIKKAVRERLEIYLDDGLEWLIFGGNLGFEYWTLAVARELQSDYPQLKLATIFPFETTGRNWDEANQAKLQAFKTVDFVKYSYPDYENPGQFKAYQQFLIENSDAALIFYDDENETRLKSFVTLMKSGPNYPLEQLDFEALQNIAENDA